MKIKFIIIVLILIVLVSIFNVFSNNDGQPLFKPLELEIGEEFTSVKYDKPMHVLNYAIDDVTGDNENDMIIILGEKNELLGNTLSNNIDVIIYNPASDTFIKSGLKKCNGATPKTIISDVTGNKIKDIILLTENEDLTKNMRILSVENGVAKEIFKQKDNKGISVTGYFQDGFRAYISAKKVNLDTIIDLKNKKENYVSSGFYEENGKVKSDKKDITTSNFTEIELVELSGQYGIKTSQRVKGFDNLDIIDQIDTIWKFENGNWNIKEAKSENLGNLLY